MDFKFKFIFGRCAILWILFPKNGVLSENFSRILDTTHVNVEADVPSDGHWVIDCPSGYSEQVSDFDCREGGGVSFPEEDLSGQIGFWTTCEDTCQIIYRIQPGDINYAARVYQKGLQTEFYYDGVNWEFIDGEGWVDIKKDFEIGQTEISVQIPHLSAEMFVVLDRLVVNGELPPVVPTTTAPTTTTTTTTTAPTTTTPTTTSPTTHTTTTPTTTTPTTTPQSTSAVTTTTEPTSEATTTELTTSETSPPIEHTIETTPGTGASSVEPSSTTESEATTPLSSEPTTESSSEETTESGSSSSTASTIISSSSTVPTSTNGISTSISTTTPTPGIPPPSTLPTVKTTTEENGSSGFSWPDFFTGKWGILIFSFLGAVVFTLTVFLCTRCICTRCGAQRGLLRRKQKYSDLDEIVSRKSDVNEEVAKANPSTNQQRHLNNDYPESLGSFQNSVYGSSNPYNRYPRAILRDSTPYMIFNDKIVPTPT